MLLTFAGSFLKQQNSKHANMSRCLSGVLGKAAKACRGAHWDVGVAPVGSGKDGGSVAHVPQSRDQASPDGAPRRGWVSCALRSAFPTSAHLLLRQRESLLLSPSSDGGAELQGGSPAPPRHTGLTEPGAQVLLKPESTLLCTEHLKVKKDSEAIMIFIL